jgi:hypothetical protein
MTFLVAPGGKDGDAARASAQYELQQLAAGNAKRIVFLNGGSQTRRESAEDWIAYYARLGIPARRINGWSLEIGT